MEFDNITFELPKDKSAPIKVIGVGGGGSNAVNYMYEEGIGGVDFIVCNTDAQALTNSNVPIKIQLGVSITEGLGAGANPDVGEQAALESIDDIKAFLDGNTKMVFVTAGMGGGTGTGAAPVIANTAKEMGILTVGIVTAPFYFEGKMRLEQARKGIERLRNHVDSLIIINNDKLRELYGNLGYKTGFAKADEVLATAAKGIAEVITYHYDTNIDLRDAKTVLADSGTAIMGSATASGEDKAKKAIQKALDSPLLNDNKITGAKNVLLLIVSGEDEITMDEVHFINEYIQEEANRNANIIMGIGTDMDLGESISVTVIATGFPHDQQDFDGKEEQSIVHRLEEDQPLTRSFNVDQPKRTILDLEDIDSTEDLPKPSNSSNINPMGDINDDKIVSNNTNLNNDDLHKEDSSSSMFYLDREDQAQEVELSINSSIDEVKSKEADKQSFQPIEQPNTSKLKSSPTTKDEPETSAIKEDFTVFTLEDDAPERTPFKPKTSVNPTYNAPNPDLNKEVKEVEVDPFDEPISESVSKQIEERRARLKKFNYTFRQNMNNVEEVENQPAFKRRGVDLNEDSNEKRGGYKMENDKNGELKIRPNNFLHDNVD